MQFKAHRGWRTAASIVKIVERQVGRAVRYVAATSLPYGTFTVAVLLAVLSISLATFGLKIEPQTNGSGSSAIQSEATAMRTRAETHSHRRRVHRRIAKKDAVATPAPQPPAQQPATPATIRFSGGQLQIDARNSSLSQILAKVSSETGLVVDGLSNDERIYGQYGPGSVSSTLTALLNGAGYNYVLVGSEGQGKMKLLLTQRSGGASSVTPTPASNNGLLSPAGAQPPTMANPSEPPHPKTPQEIFEELRRMHPPPQ